LDRSLLDRLAERPEPWRPEPGDILTGAITQIEQRTSSYDGTPYVAITIEAEAGSTECRQPVPIGSLRTFHAFHTVPRNELHKLRPQVLERIGIAYDGRGERKYEQWRIALDRSGPPIDWDAIPVDPVQGVDGASERGSSGSQGDEIPY
jgi:hypothetical protein